MSFHLHHFVSKIDMKLFDLSYILDDIIFRTLDMDQKMVPTLMCIVTSSFFGGLNIG